MATSKDWAKDKQKKGNTCFLFSEFFYHEYNYSYNFLKR